MKKKYGEEVLIKWGQGKTMQMDKFATFPQYRLLPADIQILIWKYAFLKGPCKSHDGVFICSETKLVTVRRPIPFEDGLGWYILSIRPNCCLKCLTTEDPPKYIWSERARDTMMLGNGTGSNYRIIFSKAGDLGKLLGMCSISRLVVLEEWYAVVSAKINQDEARLCQCIECRRALPAKIGPISKGEMILDVLQKMLEQARRGN